MMVLFMMLLYIQNIPLIFYIPDLVKEIKGVIDNHPQLQTTRTVIDNGSFPILSYIGDFKILTYDTYEMYLIGFLKDEKLNENIRKLNILCDLFHSIL